MNCRFIKPMDDSTLQWALNTHDTIVTIEEGTIVNGFGATIARQAEQAVGKSQCSAWRSWACPT